MKVVVNRSPWGFALSPSACEFLNVDYPDKIYKKEENRARPELIECVEVMGSGRAGDEDTLLHIANVPDGVEWEIVLVGGVEIVVEKGTNVW